MKPRWPQQQRAFDGVTSAIEGGAKRICLTSPTGSGKTRMMIDLIEWATERRWPVAQYTNRRMLLDQTKEVLESHGIQVGIRAAGFKPAILKAVQLCMSQTEASQVLQKKRRELHRAGLVLIDEAHAQKGEQMQEIIRQHVEQGAIPVGVTATPLDIGDIYDELIVAGNMSDCRACGALIPAQTFAPDEPDLKHIKQYAVGADLSEGDNAKVMMRPGVFGRVLQHWEKLNPNRRPTLLFAPGVKESIWFAEQFREAGIRSAHIDGNDIWLDGEFYESNPELRAEIGKLSESGEVPVVCNRFVLREGIDWPWLYHAIFATVFGSLTSYLQSGGRLLRAYPGMDSVIVQDHGGNWWRHGSLNADREWNLGLTNHRAVSERHERMRDKKDPEPICCPKCHALRLSGRECPKCGFAYHGQSRMVVQVDGTLKPRKGDIFRARTVQERPNTEKVWERYFYSQRKADHTFAQARAWFFHEEHYWPPKTLPLMPKHDGDWFCKISDVPRDRLIQRGEQTPQRDPQTSMFNS